MFNIQGSIILEKIVSVTNAEGPPVPIPNTEVKLCSGDNTRLATAWEDSSVLTQKVGVIIAQGPPVPIPNTEVKLCGAEDTCLATSRENRSMPTFFHSCLIEKLQIREHLICFIRKRNRVFPNIPN